MVARLLPEKSGITRCRSSTRNNRHCRCTTASGLHPPPNKCRLSSLH